MKTIEQIAEEIDENFYKENNYYQSTCEPISFAVKVGIEASKLHLEAQKEEIKKVIKETISVYNWEVPFKIIDEAYPLTNIK
jgi:hypothetical protein